jgi:hypothetical protein
LQPSPFQLEHNGSKKRDDAALYIFAIHRLTGPQARVATSETAQQRANPKLATAQQGLLPELILGGAGVGGLGAGLLVLLLLVDNRRRRGNVRLE